MFFVLRDLIAVLLGFIFEMTAGKESFLYEIKDDIARTVIAVLLMIIMPLYFRGRCNFGFKGGNAKLGLCLALWEIVVVAWNLAQIYIYKAPLVTGAFGVLAAVVHGFGPGFSEEVFCRGFVVSNLMRSRENKSHRALHCVLLSGVAFGLLHLTNVFVTGDIVAALIQVVYTAAIGIFNGAVYVRSRNLWGVILMHTLTDISAFIAVFDGSVSGMDIAFCVVGSVLFVSLALFLIRPSKQAEIEALWADDWSFGEEDGKKKSGAKTATVVTVLIAILLAVGIGVAVWRAKMGYELPDLPAAEKDLDSNVGYKLGSDGRELTLTLPALGEGSEYTVENPAVDRLILKERGEADGKYRLVFACEGNGTEKISLKISLTLGDSGFSVKDYTVSVIFDGQGKISEIKG